MVVLPELRLGLDPQLQPLGLRPSSAELRSEPLPVAVLAAGSSGVGFACLQGAQDPPDRFIFAPQAAGHPGVIQNHLQCRKNPPREKSISGQELARISPSVSAPPRRSRGTLCVRRRTSFPWKPI